MKYSRYTPLGFKDIGINIFLFVTRTPFPNKTSKKVSNQKLQVKIGILIVVNYWEH